MSKWSLCPYSKSSSCHILLCVPKLHIFCLTSKPTPFSLIGSEDGVCQHFLSRLCDTWSSQVRHLDEHSNACQEKKDFLPDSFHDSSLAKLPGQAREEFPVTKKGSPRKNTFLTSFFGSWTSGFLELLNLLHWSMSSLPWRSELFNVLLHSLVQTASALHSVVLHFFTLSAVLALSMPSKPFDS